MLKTLPNFIIIGAAKAGTTSLYAYMRQHPQIFMSPLKEPNFFAYEGEETRTFLGEKANVKFPVRTTEEYLKLFDDVRGERVVGEASPIYLESPVAALRIRNMLPDVKLLVSLRNPVDRALSDYMMAVRTGCDTSSVEDALRQESHYVQVGFYYEKLVRYFDLFHRHHIKICLYDDLQENALAVSQDIYGYLDVDSSFVPDVKRRYHVGSFPRSKAIAVMFGKLRRSERIRALGLTRLRNLGNRISGLNSGDKIELPIELRKSLMSIYRDDIYKVQDLVRLDLTEWLNI